MRVRFDVSNWSEEELSTPPTHVGYDGEDRNMRYACSIVRIGDLVQVRHRKQGRVGMFRILERLGQAEFRVEAVCE